MENEVEEVVVKEIDETQKQMLNFDLEYCRVNGITKDIIRRFWEKINFPENRIDGCWIWTAGKDGHGYGSFNFGSKVVSSHRFAYMIFKGTIKEGLLIRHICDNPSCVNPNHLLVGTHQDNTQDKLDRNRLNPAKGENNGQSILTELEVKEILYKLIDDIIVSVLAEQYNVCTGAIHAIANGVNWKHIYIQLTEEQKQKIKYNLTCRIKTKLTEELVDEILVKLLQKVSVKDLMVQYNVSYSTICSISLGKTWKKCYNKLSVLQKQQLKENTKKFSPKDNKEIRELYKTGTIQSKIAKQFNVSVPTIRKIIKRIYPYDY